MDEIFSYLKNKKNIINLLVFGILLLALPLGVQMVRQQQILKSFAARNAEVVFVPGQCVVVRGNSAVATCKDKITVSLTSPYGPPQGATSQSVQSVSNGLMSKLPIGGLVGTVYADDCSEDPEDTSCHCNDSCDGLSCGQTNECGNACGSSTDAGCGGGGGATCDANGNEYKTCDECPAGQSRHVVEKEWSDGSGWCSDMGSCQPDAACGGGGGGEPQGCPLANGSRVPEGTGNHRCVSGETCPTDSSAGVGIPVVCTANDKWVETGGSSECTFRCQPGGGGNECGSGSFRDPVDGKCYQNGVCVDGYYPAADRWINCPAEGKECVSHQGCVGSGTTKPGKYTCSGGKCVTSPNGTYTTDTCDNKCSTTTGGQCDVTANLSASCVQCIIGTDSGLAANIKKLNPTRFDKCNNDQLISHWCSSINPNGCNTVKNGACASQCGGTTTQGNTKVYIEPSSNITPGATVTVVATGTSSCSTNIVPTFGNGLTECKGGCGTGGVTDGCKLEGNPKDNNPAWWRWTCKASSTAGNYSVSFNASGNSCQSSSSYNIKAPDVFTTHFKLALVEVDLSDDNKSPWRVYTADPTEFTFDFADETLGNKQVFVRFKASNGDISSIIRKSINFVGADPAITGDVGCSLDTAGNINFNIKGKNFGKAKGSSKLTANNTNLVIEEWKEGEIKGRLANAAVAGTQKFDLTLTREDGAPVATQSCSIGISQVSLGAKLFCQLPNQGSQSNVSVSIIEDTPGATPVKETVTIDKNGIIQGLKTKVQAGKKYKIAVKVPGGLRKQTAFTAAAGTAVIPNFSMPVGDIFPTDGGDGTINALDKSELNRQWVLGASGAGRTGDFNGDGKVNSIDWACMRQHFGDSDAGEPVASSPSPSPSVAPSISPSPSPSPSASP